MEGQRRAAISTYITRRKELGLMGNSYFGWAIFSKIARKKLKEYLLDYPERIVFPVGIFITDHILEKTVSKYNFQQDFVQRGMIFNAREWLELRNTSKKGIVA